MTCILSDSITLVTRIDDPRLLLANVTLSPNSANFSEYPINSTHASTFSQKYTVTLIVTVDKFYLELLNECPEKT